MYCKNCGEQLNDNQAVCIKCGVKVGDGSKYCAKCGKPINPGASVCLGCGCAVNNTYVNPVNSNYLNGHEKVSMAILCFFLGGLGIHNFILGENKKGIFRLLMCLVCGIGYIFALIDFVKILTDSYVVDYDALI